jgi:predicted metal-binding membrane protein
MTMRIAAHLRATAGWRRMPVWIGMAGVVAASWLVLGRMSGDMAGMGGAASAHAGMAMAGMGGPSAPTLAANFVMWAVMMLAMMLPTVAPSAAVFSMLSARREPQRSGRTTALYVAGYAAVWIAYAAPAALLQWVLTHALLLDAMARSSSTLLSAAILLAAGAYQFTPLKTACLSKCRAPLGYFMAKWRDGARGALELGVQHGSYCVGCCWALMTVMFVVGAMNLAWMGLLALLLLGEKVIPAAWRFDRLVGLTLVLAGLWLATGA